MVRIKCKICGDTGYTAAPEALVCKCGGRFRVIPGKREDMIVVQDISISNLFNLPNSLNYGNN